MALKDILSSCSSALALLPIYHNIHSFYHMLMLPWWPYSPSIHRGKKLQSKFVSLSACFLFRFCSRMESCLTSSRNLTEKWLFWWVQISLGKWIKNQGIILPQPGWFWHWPHWSDRKWKKWQIYWKAETQWATQSDGDTHTSSIAETQCAYYKQQEEG